MISWCDWPRVDQLRALLSPFLLIGVSGNIVTICENKPGRLQIRKSEVRKALADLKGMKKKDVIEPAEEKKRGRKKAAAAAKTAKKKGTK